jgi:hypothetical protein
MDGLIGRWLEKFANWLIDGLLWVFKKTFELLMDGAASLIEAIPVPAFVNDATLTMALIGAEVGYWVGPFELGYGLTVIGTSLLARFTLRRVPFIG